MKSESQVTKWVDEDQEKESELPLNWVFKFKEWLLAKDFKKKSIVHEADIHSILFAFINRTRLRYHLIVSFFCRCLCLRDLASRRRDPAFKDHFLFFKAETKFRNELDVVRIVKTLRRYKNLA